MNPFMSDAIIKFAVRTIFTVTSRDHARKRAEQYRQAYLDLAESITPEQGRISVEVPPMKGIDEDMRRWSFFQVLEHNTITNRIFTLATKRLAEGKEFPMRKIDPKKDVMPGEDPGEEEAEAFFASIDDHLNRVEKLGSLRGTRISPHPVFGDFDAHKWNCMFTFHLGLHLKQAAYVVQEARRKPD